jgi:hypothetical protein
MISEKQNLQSQFVTYLSVDCKSKINQELIEPRVKNFFDAKNISAYKPIDSDKAISDLDFKTVDFSYFYDVIFYDIAKNKEGKIEIPVKYCITLDKKNCPQEIITDWYMVLNEVPVEPIYTLYDEIFLYNQPVFYFIYVDIKDIFYFLRK